MVLSGLLMSKKRKTRQEKIIADLRKKLEATKTRNRSNKGVINSESVISTLPTTRPTTQDSIQYPTSYIKKNLTKTITLAILVISLELVIYFFTG